MFGARIHGFPKPLKMYGVVWVFVTCNKKKYKHE